jgi:protein-S-isoprenylcysteine O-methyltransferase Ste14
MSAGVIVLFACGTTAWSLWSPIVEELLFFVGIAIAGFGAAGRAWATSFISGNKSRELVNTGPYSMCRNPLYLFSWMMGVGIGFCSETFTGPVVIGSGLLLLYHFQIKREEEHLLEMFGQPYEQYLATVPRFFPSWHAYNEPEEIRISPRVMKRGVFGIAFLLLLIGAMELLEVSHQSGLLPSLFRIY